MKRNRFFVFAIICAALKFLPVFAADANKYVGEYRLLNQMEMAGGLILAKDQKYVAGFSVGGLDWQETGVWKLESDDTIVLLPDAVQVRGYRQNGKPVLLLPANARLTYKEGELTYTKNNEKIVFLDPSKTLPRIPATNTANQRPAESCLALTPKLSNFNNNTYHTNNASSLASVDDKQVVVRVDLFTEVVIRRAWADKNIPSLLNPPKLYEVVFAHIPAEDVLCVRHIPSGKGMVSFRGRVTSLNSKKLVIHMGACYILDVNALPEAVLVEARKNIGKAIDMEIPGLAISSHWVGSGGCPQFQPLPESMERMIRKSLSQRISM